MRVAGIFGIKIGLEGWLSCRIDIIPISHVDIALEKVAEYHSTNAKEGNKKIKDGAHDNRPRHDL